MRRRRSLLQGLVGAPLAVALAGKCGRAHAAAAGATTAGPGLPPELRLDYAYYSPASLVLKRQGWIEQQAQPSGTAVRWVQSLGSNRALEFLASGAVDFGSTAGLAAVLGRANGNPISTVWIYSRPEWTALAVNGDSPVRTLAQLKGLKVAATKGTDPYLFLLRSLHENGLTRSDVEIVHLQHPDGRVALQQRRVDAWAGLDPHLAASQLQDGTRLLYRNIAFNTYGFLNVPTAFAAQYPGAIALVLDGYERARRWILAHPEETAATLAQEANLPIDVARLQLSRTDFSKPAPGAEQVAALRAAAPILLQEQLVKQGVDLDAVIGTLVREDFARSTLAREEGH
jgi:sulfonate transport system substrate-binding protein